MKRIYLDYASLTPMREQVKKKVREVLDLDLADPGRIYSEALISRELVEQARANLASYFNVSSRQVIFCSSGSEANMLAIFSGLKNADVVLLSAIEHSSITNFLNSMSALNNKKVDLIEVSRSGMLNLNSLSDKLKTYSGHEKKVLVICQSVNQEIGVVQDIETIAKLCQSFGALLLSDSCQAFGQIPFNPIAYGASFVTISSHKIGGPPGVGALILGPGQRVAPIFPGSQERARRGGMENIIGIVGFGEAVNIISEASTFESELVLKKLLKDRALSFLLDFDDVEIYGESENCSPHILCFGSSLIESEALVLGLDKLGVAIHSGSACSSEILEPSKVLEALGIGDSRAIRLSFGYRNTLEDLDYFFEAFSKVRKELLDLRS